MRNRKPTYSSSSAAAITKAMMHRRKNLEPIEALSVLELKFSILLDSKSFSIASAKACCCSMVISPGSVTVTTWVLLISSCATAASLPSVSLAVLDRASISGAVS